MAMSYVERNLIPGEKLIYLTGVHWSVLFGPGTVAAILAGAGISVLAYRDGIATTGVLILGIDMVGLVLLIVAAILLGYGVAKKNATEIAVTDRRVMIKTGMTSRRSLEIALAKVESVGITESVMGRILGFGTVVIHGTGSTPEPFTKIAHPAEFRMAVQREVDAAKR